MAFRLNKEQVVEYVKNTPIQSTSVGESHIVSAPAEIKKTVLIDEFNMLFAVVEEDLTHLNRKYVYGPSAAPKEAKEILCWLAAAEWVKEFPIQEVRMGAPVVITGKWSR